MNDRSEFQGGSSTLEPDDEFQALHTDDLSMDLTPIVPPSVAVESEQQISERLEGAIAWVDDALVRLNSREMLPATEARDLFLDLRHQLVTASTDKIPI